MTDEPNIQPENETLPLVQFWEQMDHDARSPLGPPEPCLRDRILDELWWKAAARGEWWWGIHEIQREVERTKD